MRVTWNNANELIYVLQINERIVTRWRIAICRWCGLYANTWFDTCVSPLWLYGYGWGTLVRTLMHDTLSWNERQKKNNLCICWNSIFDKFRKRLNVLNRTACSCRRKWIRIGSQWVWNAQFHGDMVTLTCNDNINTKLSRTRTRAHPDAIATNMFRFGKYKYRISQTYGKWMNTTRTRMYFLEKLASHLGWCWWELYTSVGLSFAFLTQRFRLPIQRSIAIFAYE